MKNNHKTQVRAGSQMHSSDKEKKQTTAKTQKKSQALRRVLHSCYRDTRNSYKETKETQTRHKHLQRQTLYMFCTENITECRLNCDSNSSPVAG